MNQLPIEAGAVAAHCKAGGTLVAIESVAETGSTNADLLARAATLERPTLRVAHQQTAGRGRAGRSWLSEPGATLMFSLAWRFDAPLHKLAGLPLAVGVALAETLAGLGVPVTLKWPNDLIKDGSKLAGILVESLAGADAGVWTVIGVGINLLMPDPLEQRIGRSVAAAPWLANMERAALMAALLDGLTGALDQFAQAGFAPFSARWNHRHAYQGQPVVILDNGQVVQQGLAAGVDQSGRLLLDTAQGRVEVLSGDVSLRALAQ